MIVVRALVGLAGGLVIFLLGAGYCFVNGARYAWEFTLHGKRAA